MQMRCEKVLVALVLAAACSCRGLPKASSLPAPKSDSVQVGQLVFHADFALANDHRLVRELIAERDDVSRMLGLPYTNEPIHVHLFRDADAYRAYLKREIPNAPTRRAFFVKSDTRLCVYAHWSDRVAEDLRHEVAHGYLHAALPNLPLWLDEGLAEYFEVPRGHGGLNRPHVSLLSDMVELDGWRPDLEALEQLTDARQMTQPNYAESWAWVHFLLSHAERREVLIAYLRDLREQGATPPLSRRLEREQLKREPELLSHIAALKVDSGATNVATGPYPTRR